MFGSFLFYLKYYLTNSWVNRMPFHSLRSWWYRKILKMQIHPTAQIFMGLTLLGNKISSIQMGENSIINPNCLLNASDSIRIGNDVVLAHDVKIHTADHDIQSPGFEMRTAPVTIEDHAWIASHVILLKGIRIGRGAVVAAGSVVTKSVEDFSVVAGNPARVIAQRPQIHFPKHSPTSPPLFC